MIGINVFIGSSSEGLHIAQQVQYDLHHETAPRVWNQGVFELGGMILTSLLKKIKNHDFAILVLTPDDLTISRDSFASSLRDNVIFELGLFMGRLGPHRTFVLYDDSVDLKLLSDLHGVTLAPYDGKWAKMDIHAAIGTACNPIRQTIRHHGPRGTHPYDSEFFARISDNFFLA